MHLHSFGTFFEALAALNFVFTGSETFLAGLNNQIARFVSTFFSWFKDWLTKFFYQVYKVSVSLNVAIAENSNIKQDYFDRLKLDFDSLGSNLSGLDRLEIRRRNFVFSFRAIFLVSGLFCLYVLLAEGYDQFCTSGCPKGEMDISMPICLLFCSFGVFIISGLIFLNSFGHKKTSEQGYNGFWIGVFFILFAYFSISLEKHLRPIIIYSLQWNPRLIITFPVLAAVFPYILHIIRVILHKLKFSFLKSKVLIKMFVCSRALYLANNQKNTKKNTTEWVADIYKKHKGFFWKPTLEAIKTKITGDLNKVLALVFIAVHERNVRPVYSKNIMVRSLQKMYLWWR